MSPGHPLFELARADVLGAAKSAWLTRQHFPGRLDELPINVSRSSKVRLRPGSDFEIDGRLWLGFPVVTDATQPTILRVERGGRLRIRGSAFMGLGTQVVVGEGATVTIGDRVTLSGNSQFVAASALEIGAYSAVSFGTLIMDSHFHQVRSGDEPAQPQSAPVRVGEKVLIGARATILAGVTIGDGAVVAAGSVVTADVPERTLVGGVPAKVVRRSISWA